MAGAGRYRHRVTIQERRTIPGPDGPITEWVNAETRWARVVLVGLEGREKYQQLGHSQVRNAIHFRGAVDVTLGQHRFKWRGKSYVPIEPPADPTGMGTETVVAVAEAEEAPNMI